MMLKVGDMQEVTALENQLRELGFKEVEYVYEPGQFAVRGSILDVFSFSSEYPFRLDFFGDEIDSIRTFEVQSQLSRDKKESVEIVPELASLGSEKIPFMQFLPADTVLVMKSFLFVRDSIEQTYRAGFSSQAITERMEGATEMEQHVIMKEAQAESFLLPGSRFSEEAADFRKIEIGNRPTGMPQATISFDVTPQPLFHKNFDLLISSLSDYLERGYRLYILADSAKQQQRLREIFNSMSQQPITFMPVDKTLHEGFVDNNQKICLFTDHQIFDRFHKYSLRSDAARSGKVALTLKELRRWSRATISCMWISE